MIVPKNEGKSCDAAVKALEKWKGAPRAEVRRPEKDGIGPRVDLRFRLGAQHYAIEHTVIESFESQIAAHDIAEQIERHIRRAIPDPFPSRAYYELQFPVGVRLPRQRARMQALDALVDWVRTKERTLRMRNASAPRPVRYPYMANDEIRDSPAGFDCEFALLHWPVVPLMGVPPGALGFRFIQPDDPEGMLERRLRRAFADKCPKLEQCRREGARTVLVLESGMPGLHSFAFRGGLLPAVLAGGPSAPDEVFLVETLGDRWWVWLLKRDADHWPRLGMLDLSSFYYDPDASDGPGIPEWLESEPPEQRNAFQLARMYTPFQRGWAPLIFEQGELDDLTLI